MYACVCVCACVCARGGHSRDTRKAKYRLNSPNRDFNARMISSKSSGRATATRGAGAGHCLRVARGSGATLVFTRSTSNRPTRHRHTVSPSAHGKGGQQQQHRQTECGLPQTHALLILASSSIIDRPTDPCCKVGKHHNREVHHKQSRKCQAGVLFDPTTTTTTTTTPSRVWRRTRTAKPAAGVLPLS